MAPPASRVSNAGCGAVATSGHQVLPSPARSGAAPARRDWRRPPAGRKCGRRAGRRCRSRPARRCAESGAPGSRAPAATSHSSPSRPGWPGRGSRPLACAARAARTSRPRRPPRPTGACTSTGCRGWPSHTPRARHPGPSPGVGLAQRADLRKRPDRAAATALCGRSSPCRRPLPAASMTKRADLR